YLADFSNLESSIEATLIGFTKQDAGSGTYMVRIGGTSGNADGQLVAVLSTSNSSYPNGPASVKGEPFINPMGWQLVKLTAAGSLVNIKASIKNPSIEIG
ncbi:MAG TPA: hypothetical protein VHD33_00675, partial [Legionellaceae bacterium]|nr:hypothetical protein [Legionellaceae bacterium]